MLDVKDIEEDILGLAMDGTTEWTAVSMELPQESSACQLACLLLCKGVQKSQVSIYYTQLLNVTNNNYSIPHVAYIHQGNFFYN